MHQSVCNFFYFVSELKIHTGSTVSVNNLNESIKAQWTVDPKFVMEACDLVLPGSAAPRRTRKKSDDQFGATITVLQRRKSIVINFNCLCLIIFIHFLTLENNHNTISFKSRMNQKYMFMLEMIKFKFIKYSKFGLLLLPYAAPIEIKKAPISMLFSNG